VTASVINAPAAVKRENAFTGARKRFHMSRTSSPHVKLVFITMNKPKAIIEKKHRKQNQPTEQQSTIQGRKRRKLMIVGYARVVSRLFEASCENKAKKTR